jgi:single-strand DNA-binding protein
MSFNKAIIIGRLTKDVELKTTGSGVSVASFTVAVDRGYGDNKKTDFINCVAWRQTAEFTSKFFQKGSQIGVEGSIQVRDYTDKDGNKRYVTEIVASNAFFVGSKETNGANGNRNTGNFSPLADDLPFDVEPDSVPF